MTTTLLEKEIGTDVMTDVMEFTLLGKLTKEKKQKHVRINVTETLGKYPKPGRKKFVAYEEEGKQIFPLIKQALDNNCKVTLSCQDVDPTQGFVDEAIGMLYGHYNMEFVDNNLEIVGVDELGQYSIDSTLRLSKLYHYHRNVYDRLMKQFAEDAGECWDEEEEEDTI
jgi:hypothetical protein